MTDLAMLSGGDLWEELELWTGRAIECSNHNGLFCGSLQSKSVEKNEDDGDLGCEVSEGRKDSVRARHVIHLN